MSATQYTYSIANDFPYQRVNTSQLESEILVAGLTTFLSVDTTPEECSISFSDELSVQHKADLDALVAAHPGLAALKFEKCCQIDLHTDALIDRGFNYEGNQYSMSIEAQARMLGTYVLKDHPAITYPLTWNSLNDDHACSLDNADDVTQFFLTGVATYTYHINTGTALKARVRAATNKAELDAIIDAR